MDDTNAGMGEVTERVRSSSGAERVEPWGQVSLGSRAHFSLGRLYRVEKHQRGSKGDLLGLPNDAGLLTIARTERSQKQGDSLLTPWPPLQQGCPERFTWLAALVSHREGGDDAPYEQNDHNGSEGQRGGRLVRPRHAVIEAEGEEERQREEGPGHQQVLGLANRKEARAQNKR